MISLYDSLQIILDWCLLNGIFKNLILILQLNFILSLFIKLAKKDNHKSCVFDMKEIHNKNMGLRYCNIMAIYGQNIRAVFSCEFKSGQ